MTLKGLTSLSKIAYRSFAAGWVALIFSEAAYFYILAPRRLFDSGLGVSGAFAVFALTYSFAYFLTASSLVLPFLLLSRHVSQRWVPLVAMGGGTAFAVAAYLVCWLWIDFDRSGTIQVTIFWFISGLFFSGSMAVLSKRTEPTERGNQSRAIPGARPKP